MRSSMRRSRSPWVTKSLLHATSRTVPITPRELPGLEIEDPEEMRGLDLPPSTTPISRRGTRLCIAGRHRPAQHHQHQCLPDEFLIRARRENEEPVPKMTQRRRE